MNFFWFAAVCFFSMELSTDGDSASWQSTNATVIKLFNESFRSSSPSLSALPEFKECGPDILCTQKIYNQFAHYLVYDYRIAPTSKHPSGHLAMRPVLNYLGSLVNSARKLFSRSADAGIKLFFTCTDLNSQSEHAVWMRKLRIKTRSIIFTRQTEAGEKITHNVPPVSLNNAIGLRRAYAHVNTPEVLIHRHASY